MHFYLPKPYARAHRTQGNDLGEQGGVRIYRESPETCALQLRAWGTVTGKGRESYIHVSLTKDELALVIKELVERLQELEDVAARRVA